MKIGLHIPDVTWRGGAPRLRKTLGEVVDAAESGGFDLIAVADHVWMARDVIPAAAELTVAARSGST